MDFDATRAPAPGIVGSRQGFTLIELLTVLTITGIVAIVAVPGFGGFVGKQHLRSTGRILYGDLKRARSEAVTRARRVHICKSPDGGNCAADAHWNDGWIVFQDMNENRQRDPGEGLIQIRQATPRDVRIRFGSLDPTGIAFEPSGDATFNGTFALCSRRHNAPSQVIIFHASGRPRFAARRADGRPVSCD